ncbi:hypothetical protein ACLBKT_16450 [Erythrobacter sp. W302b]|jgi:hypothetical protein|uniref:hypothetical protein n=1 Tax=Erythrobacter sp. W302b TaxID=3389874 RepID=UPI00396B2987
MLTLLDILRTPMAAPETRSLKVMRMTILAICGVLVVSIAAIDPLRAVIGIGAGAVVAGLLLVLAALVPVYLVIKTGADDAHLSALIAETDK